MTETQALLTAIQETRQQLRARLHHGQTTAVLQRRLARMIARYITQTGLTPMWHGNDLADQPSHLPAMCRICAP